MTSKTVRKRSGTVGVEVFMGDLTPIVSADEVQTSAAKTTLLAQTSKHTNELPVQQEASTPEGPTPDEASLTSEGPTPRESRVEPVPQKFSEDDSLRSWDDDPEALRSAKQKARQKRRRKDRRWYVARVIIINLIALLLCSLPLVVLSKWDFSILVKIIVGLLSAGLILLGLCNVLLMVCRRTNDSIEQGGRLGISLLFGAAAADVAILIGSGL